MSLEKDVRMLYLKLSVFSGCAAQVYLGIDNFSFKNSKMYKEFHIAKAIIFGYMPLTPFPHFILAEE